MIYGAAAGVNVGALAGDMAHPWSWFELVNAICAILGTKWALDEYWKANRESPSDKG